MPLDPSIYFQGLGRTKSPMEYSNLALQGEATAAATRQRNLESGKMEKEIETQSQLENAAVFGADGMLDYEKTASNLANMGSKRGSLALSMRRGEEEQKGQLQASEIAKNMAQQQKAVADKMASLSEEDRKRTIETNKLVFGALSQYKDLPREEREAALPLIKQGLAKTLLSMGEKPENLQGIAAFTGSDAETNALLISTGIVEKAAREVWKEVIDQGGKVIFFDPSSGKMVNTGITSGQALIAQRNAATAEMNALKQQRDGREKIPLAIEKNNIELINNASAGVAASSDILDMANRMVVNSSKFETGPGATIKTFFEKGKSLVGNQRSKETVAAIQQMEQDANALTLLFKTDQATGKNKMAGSLSDRDLKFLQASVVGLESGKITIEEFAKRAKTLYERAESRMAFINKYERSMEPMSEFAVALREYDQQNRMDQRGQKNEATGGGCKAPQTNNAANAVKLSDALAKGAKLGWDEAKTRAYYKSRGIQVIE